MRRSKFPHRALVFSFMVAVVNLAVAPQLWAGGAQVGILSNVEGKVVIEREGEIHPAALGQSLMKGDVIRTQERSKATLIYDSGEVLVLEPNAEMTLGRKVSKKQEGLISRLVSGVASFFKSAEEESVGAVGGVRSAALTSTRIQPVAPYNSTIFPGDLTFSWEAFPNAERYRFVIFGKEGKVLDKRLAGDQTHFTSQELTLERGAPYFWTVTATVGISDYESSAILFTVLSEEGEASIREVAGKVETEQRRGLDPSSAHIMLGMQYEQQGMYDHAIAEFRSLAELFPKEPMPHRHLARLYVRTGRVQEAEAEYQHLKSL